MGLLHDRGGRIARTEGNHGVVALTGAHMWLCSSNERPCQLGFLFVHHFNDRFTLDPGLDVTDLGPSRVVRTLSNSHGHTIREVPTLVVT
jgi:hypothetical protein